MKNNLLAKLVIMGCLIITSCSEMSSDNLSSSRYVLNYDKPATQWKESLPIGNGRMGTMVAGCIASDTLVMNEETIWTGGPHDYINPNAKEHLQEVRDLIAQRQNDKAKAVADKYMVGIPKKQQAYQPATSIIINSFDEGEVTNYSRTLDLNRALVNIDYEQNGESYKREYFASNPDDIIVVRFTTTAKQGLNMDIVQSSLQNDIVVTVSEDSYKINGNGSAKSRNIKSAIKFASVIKVVEGLNKSTIDHEGIHVRGAKELVLHYTAESNYVKYNDVSGDPDKLCSNILSKVDNVKYKTLKDRHIADYKSLFDRMQINLGSDAAPQITTDSLVRYVRAGGVSSYLDEMFYQMGRYLTIASSRVGSQPMNLQGLWNDEMVPAWDSKWTLNINLSMNYWLCESANLSECHLPCIELVKDLNETGAKVAREHYGCRGFVTHHNTDLWKGAAPVDGANWGMWTMGGAWTSRHIWEHYQFTQDTTFLRENYGALKDASLFFFDYLSEGSQGYLVSSPAISSEQNGKFADGQSFRLCDGPTMDNQILRDLFNNCLASAKIVCESNTSFTDSLVYFRDRLKPTTIDPNRKDLMEWAYDASPDVKNGQLAPLWGVCPGVEINPVDTPDLAAAAIKTIQLRDPHIASYETCGSWVSGIRSNYWARLYDGESAYKVITKLYRENLYTNLLASFYHDKHFQIDGNLGTAASFCEMILQSQRSDKENKSILDILPALPKAWSDGSVKGLRARGGFEVDMAWSNGELTSMVIRSEMGGSCSLRYKDKLVAVEVKAGEEKSVMGLIN